MGGLLDGNPYFRASLALFAELVREADGGPVADVGRGPGHVTRWLREAGFTIEAEPIMRPDDDVPGAIVLARRHA